MRLLINVVMLLNIVDRFVIVFFINDVINPPVNLSITKLVNYPNIPPFDDVLDSNFVRVSVALIIKLFNILSVVLTIFVMIVSIVVPLILLTMF